MRKILKRASVCALAVILLLSLCACSAIKTASNTKNIVGGWRLTKGDGGSYGAGLLFGEDKKLGFSLDIDLGENIDSQQLADALTNAVSGLISMTYEVKTESIITVTSSKLLGFSTEATDVEYSLDGDTLVFDGSTYTRVK